MSGFVDDTTPRQGGNDEEKKYLNNFSFTNVVSAFC